MRGVHVLTEALKSMPSLPGVYKMMGEKGILYIGKAKNLKARVKSYTNIKDATPKNAVMIQNIRAVQYEIVRTEVDALILESSLIKQHKPQFNIALKDDKSHPYIVVSKKDAFPSISKYRGKPPKGYEVYGPFGDHRAVEAILNIAYKTFKLRSCSDIKFKMAKRPCLEYQIKRCTAPCSNLISQEDYMEEVRLALSFLAGKTKEVLKTLQQKMEEHAEKEEYEKAAEIRDKILGINRLLGTEKIDFKRFEDTDAILIKELAGQVAIEVFSIRRGFSYGGSVFFPSRTENESLENILEFFIGQHYLDNEIPSQIIIDRTPSNFAEIKKALIQISGKSLKIIVPVKGKLLEIIKFAEPNINEKLELKVRHATRTKENMFKLKELLGLPAIPDRIEVYDNSHTNGAFFVGGMIVAGENGFVKSEYRKFNAKFPETGGGDDYAMLREVLKRRFLNEKLVQVLPDLIIIDGGKGQLSSAKAALNEIDINIPFICIAKGRDRNAGKEKIYFEDKEIILQTNDPLLYYLQTLRDEAHRFAITFHRSKREKF